MFKRMLPLLAASLVSLGGLWSLALEGTLNLQGLPVQIEWADIDGDDRMDLLALMVMTQTEGQMDTVFQDGRLIGFYEDLTVKEKYLATYVWREGKLVEASRVDLGKQQVLGFAVQQGAEPALALWLDQGLTLYGWSESTWQAGKTLPTPGFLGQSSVLMSEFPFFQTIDDRSYWLVPGLDGFYQVDLKNAENPLFVAYPDHVYDADSVRDGVHTLQFSVPLAGDVDGGGPGEVFVHGGDYATAWRLGQTRPAFTGDAKGTLVDLNGDGMLDLVQTAEIGDIERRKDLPKVKTEVAVFHAVEPLRFAEEADVRQPVPGFVLEGGESDLELANPFLDLNGDGLTDIAGVAFKFSAFQIAKVLVTGRFTLTFLLQLSVQQPDHSFEPLRGGPFEMKWTFNIRRLKMPTFAQMTGDFNGDGWVDLLMNEGKRIEITPLSAKGYGLKSTWKVKLPRTIRDPDQVYGKDLDQDSTDELILLKTGRGNTLLSVMEAQ